MSNPSSDWTEFIDYEVRINRALGDNPLLRDEGDIPIKLCGQPLFISHDIIDTVQKSSELIWRAAEKAVSHIVRNRLYSPNFEVHQRFEQFNSADRTFPWSLYLSRFDFRLENGTVPKFIELNTACPGMPAFFACWRALIAENYPKQDLSEELGRFILDDPFAFPEALIDIARVHYDKRQQLLNVAIVNDDAGLSWELDYISDLFQRLGHKSEVTHVGNLTYDGERLFGSKRSPLDIVYAKAWPVFSSGDGWQEKQFAAYGDFLTAYKSDSICIMNPIPAMTIGEDKALLAFLSQGLFDFLLDEEECEAVKSNLPATSLLNRLDDKTLINAVERKDCLVLKPRQDMRGKDVLLGADCSEREWHEVLKQRQTDGTWIIQEFVEPIGQHVPRAQAGQTALMPVGETLTAFMLGRDFAGLMSRISDTALNNLHSGGMVQCVVSLDQ